MSSLPRGFLLNTANGNGEGRDYLKGTGSMGITRELVRHAESQAPPPELQNQALRLNKTPGGLVPGKVGDPLL